MYLPVGTVIEVSAEFLIISHCLSRRDCAHLTFLEIFHPVLKDYLGVSWNAEGNQHKLAPKHGDI